MAAARRLTVLMVAMNYLPERSGTAPYTAAWAEHLAQRHRVAVLAGPPHYPEWKIHDGYGQWRHDESIDGVRVRRLRHHVPAKTSALGRIAHETTFAARVLTQRIGRPDVVIAISPPLFGAAAGLVLARRLGVPFGLVVQDIYTAGVRELGAASGGVAARAAAGISALERRVATGADAVLSIHDRFATTLTTQLGVKPDKISIVGNWVHIPPPSRTRAEQRAQLGWDDDFVILHAGNMGAKQGLENVVAAAKLADVDRLPLRYVLMGDGNQRPTLERLAAGVQSIQFLPSADSASYADILRAADLLLVNERPEVQEMSLPSKLTSYCAAGQPILAATGSGGATAAVLTSSGAGVVVPPGRPDAVNAAAMTLLGHPERAAELGQRGSAYASANYQATQAMQGYDRWLDGLAALPAAP